MYIIKCSLWLTTNTVLIKFKQCDGKAKGTWIIKYALFCVLILSLGLALGSEEGQKSTEDDQQAWNRFEK